MPRSSEPTGAPSSQPLVDCLDALPRPHAGPKAARLLVLVYERECGLCAASARLVQRLARAPVEITPLEDARPMGLLTALGQ